MSTYPKYLYKLILLFILSASSACTNAAERKPGGLWAIDISHDDKYIALGGDDSLLRIFSSDFKLLKSVKLETKGMVRAVHWHPHENILAVASRNDIWIWNPETGAETTLAGNHGGSRTIAWNHTGDMLASAAGKGILWIWNRNGELLRQIQKKDAEGNDDLKDFLGLDWQPGTNRLVTVGDEIRVFDTSGKQWNVFKHREQRAGLLTVKWHPSGEFFVTGDYGHLNEGIPTLLQFWKPDGTLIAENRESKREFRNIRWNRDGTLLATASDAVRIWTKDGKLVHNSDPGNTVYWGVDWTNNSKKLYTVNYETGNIQSWTVEGKLLESHQ
jgi:WD40 repeat protein